MNYKGNMKMLLDHSKYPLSLDKIFTTKFNDAVRKEQQRLKDEAFSKEVNKLIAQNNKQKRLAFHKGRK